MEIDVQLSSDGVPVLMHDLTVDRTTNLHGPVRSHSAAVLQAADAGNGEPVPTLAQVLDLVAGRLTVMCELKATPGDPAHDQACVDAVLGVIDSHDARAWTAIHSFNPDMVERARNTDSRISAAIISPVVDETGLERLLGGLLKRNGQAVSIQHDCINADLVVRARRRQVTVWAWTADLPADWARLTDAGVAGIITNVPHSLKAWFEAR
jgi:glycerophosphoryl diester phosphodiesterase